MYKVTDRCSVAASLSIFTPEELCPTAPHSSQSREDKNSKPANQAQTEPLYLFACALLWHKQGDAEAAWDLIHSLRSADPAIQAVASALLAKKRIPAPKSGIARPRLVPPSPGYRS